MDHDIFLAWLNESDNLSPGQRAEASRILSGSPSLQAVVDLLEAKVRENRICRPVQCRPARIMLGPRRTACP